MPLPPRRYISTCRKASAFPAGRSFDGWPAQPGTTFLTLRWREGTAEVSGERKSRKYTVLQGRQYQ